MFFIEHITSRQILPPVIVVTRLGEDQTRMINTNRVSGVNYAKNQVGVAVFLAHVGSFVPAEKAIIGLTDRIYTRISTVETSALPQSTFTIDVNQAS